MQVEQDQLGQVPVDQALDLLALSVVSRSTPPRSAGARTPTTSPSTATPPWRTKLDCQDRSGPGGSGTAGTENGWQDNVGVTDDPDGLCTPPVVDDTPDDDGKDHGKPHKKHKKQSKQHGKKHRPDPCACASHPRSM